MHEYLFLRPLDVLYLRGNSLFGQAGDHSEALMPPWPSVAAGAIRTRILADHLRGSGISIEEYAAEGRLPEGPLGACLGTPGAPGAFQLTHFSIARMANGGAEVFMPLPADTVVQETDPGACRYLVPQKMAQGVLSSYPLGALPVLRSPAPGKSLGGMLLTLKGLAAYLEGAPIKPEHMTKAEDLWRLETRLGIGLSALTRTADEGRIYTSMVVAMREKTGFLAGVAGASGLVPRSGLLRFGGDGRSVEIRPCSLTVPEPHWETLKKTGRFKLMFQTPGLFPDGWRLPGLERREEGWRWVRDGFDARLAAVAFPRPEVISGWDLAESRPKPALRSVAMGSVYWFEDLHGDLQALRRLLTEGVQAKDNRIFDQRRAEGFNRVFIGAWPQEAA